MSTISASVGRNGVNRSRDVIIIQRLLNKATIPGVTEPLKADGLSGPNTIARIARFQEQIMNMRNPDSRVDPGMNTIKRLVEATADARSTLTLSAEGLNLLTTLEGRRLRPYDDQTGEDIRVWTVGATIGYGHLISRSDWEKYKNGVTAAEAEALLKTDLADYVSTVNEQVKTGLSQNQFDALVLFCFNIGRRAFSASSVLKLINDPNATTNYPNLEAAWKAWNKSRGILNQGLVNRRNSEWNVYANNVYQAW